MAMCVQMVRSPESRARACDTRHNARSQRAGDGAPPQKDMRTQECRRAMSRAADRTRAERCEKCVTVTAHKGAREAGAHTAIMCVCVCKYETQCQALVKNVNHQCRFTDMRPPLHSHGVCDGDAAVVFMNRVAPCVCARCPPILIEGRRLTVSMVFNL